MSLIDEIRSAQIRAGEDAVMRNLEHLGFALPPQQTNDGKMFVLDLANRVCEHLPEGWQLDLCMERGAAWVRLTNLNGTDVSLPDSTDKSLEQQVNDAICLARGWKP